MISPEQVREIFAYDPIVGIVLWRSPKANCVKIGDRAGNRRQDGYRSIEVGGKAYFEHRLIWAHVHGEWPLKHIDHINGDRSDNRLSNLREASVQENAQNRKRRSDNKSGFAGVSRHKDGKWVSSITVAQTSKYLGIFKTPEEARDAYLQAKATFHTFQPVPRDV